MSWKATRNSLAVATALAAAPPAAARAVWDTHAPERGFMFRGKPVDPRCVEPMLGPSMDHPETVDLARCAGTVARKSSVGRDQGGFFTADPLEDAPDRTDYSFYRVVARNGDLFALDSEFNDGGTGTFAGVSLVRFAGGKVALVDILGYGDRCNGSASSDGAKGAVLSWSESVTPADLVLLATGRQDGDDNLPMSAISCVATQDKEYDLGSRKTRWVSVTLTGDTEAGDGTSKLLDENADDGYVHERCFNRLYDRRVRSKHLVLTPAMVKQFGADFSRTCLKKAP